MNNLRAMLCLSLAMAWAPPGAAQAFPWKPIELVSPTGAGGGSDLVARNMYEDVYMNAGDLARYLSAQRTELTQFLTEMGLVLKK